MNDYVVYGLISLVGILVLAIMTVVIGEWYAHRHPTNTLLPPPADQVWKYRNSPRQRDL